MTVALMLSISASAAIVGGQSGTISNVTTYPQFGGGDAVIYVSPALSGCDGFWLSAGDPGFKTVYAQVLAAWTTHSVIRIWAYDDQIWTGSGGRFCRIQAFSGDAP